MDRILLGNVMGPKGDEGTSAYGLAVRNGYTGTETEWLESLHGRKGDSGESAYMVAVRNGYSGTEAEWLESLKGAPGDPGEPGPAGSYDILASSDAVRQNASAGKIVDALVIKEVFQSVSEGKELIASAITDKGIQTDADNTFQEMANHISEITSGGGGGKGISLCMYEISGLVATKPAAVKEKVDASIPPVEG